MPTQGEPMGCANGIMMTSPYLGDPRDQSAAVSYRLAAIISSSRSASWSTKSKRTCVNRPVTPSDANSVELSTFVSATTRPSRVAKAKSSSRKVSPGMLTCVVSARLPPPETRK